MMCRLMVSTIPLGREPWPLATVITVTGHLGGFVSGVNTIGN
jgi:hypothetical protein